MKSSNKSAGADDLILIGRITGAHGIRGGLKVHAYTETAELFQEGEPVRLVLADGTVSTLTLDWVAPHGRGLRLGLESVADRDTAERLAGASLYVEKARLPALEEDTYYWFELVGLAVYDTAGLLLGRLHSVIPTAANDVYVVRGDVNGVPRETLIPAIGDVVLSVDLDRRTMVVALPEGL